MQPESFLDAARRLASGARPEDLRSAISRAYYGVYNVAERFLDRMNFHKPAKDHHQILQKRLMVSGDAQLRQLGSDLGDFHKERIDADYKMANHRVERQANAQAAVGKAQRMIDVLDACPINSARWKQIQHSIATVNITGTDHLAIASGN
jgi:hypothetical protein